MVHLKRILEKEEKVFKKLELENAIPHVFRKKSRLFPPHIFKSFPQWFSVFLRQLLAIIHEANLV